MTTSSEYSKPTLPHPGGEHWSELSAALTTESTTALDRWMDQDLSTLELRLKGFITPDSLRKSLRR